LARSFLALALAGLAGVSMAQPVPRAAPRLHAGDSPQAAADPIGALLAHQAAAHPQSVLPVVIGMKLGESKAGTRFEIEISDPVKVRVFTLANPDRVVIDMPEVLWRVATQARPSGTGVVRSYRYGLFRKGNSRLVIDLAGPVSVGKPQLLPPDAGLGFRLQFDLAAASPDAFLAHAGWPDGIAAPSAAPPQPNRFADSTGKKTVVIDAGHGGIDPGTHGESGLEEKDVVLAVAKRLRDTLEATGHYKVQLTRDTDVFIPLRERVAIARAAHGDLFVSLHADSNDHHDIRGASVYTLSEDASDREAAKLADKENMSDVIAGVDLSGENNPVASILIDLAQRDTMNRSVRFAESVLKALPVATMVRPTSPHRSAGFAVLKAPDVPAVLVELGYLTNRKDESEMETQAWRAQVAQALTNAINVHFGLPVQAYGRQAAVQ
jgi:N-acetylmuramoyl-L-alanine amidase